MTDMACIVCRSSSTKVLALLLCVLATFHVAVDVREAWTKFRSKHRDVQGEELAPNDFRDGNVGFVYIDGNSPANTGKRQLQARQEAAPNPDGAARHARSISESSVEEIPLQPWAGQDRSLRAEVDRFFNFISSPQIPCEDLRPMPPFNRNQNEVSPWRLCYDHAHGGALGNPQAEECVVYSFSLERKDPFALALAHTGCEVHVFDPDLEGEEHQQVGDELWVHRAALDWRDSHHEGEGGRWHTRRFTSIMRDLGHNTVDVVRMDLEGLEWKVLEDMLLEGAMSRIHQLLVEVHLHWSGFQVMGDPPQVVRYWYSLLNQLHNQNYRLVGMFNHDLVPDRDSLSPGENKIRTFNQNFFEETEMKSAGGEVEVQGPGRPKTRLSPSRFLQDARMDVGCCHVLVWINTHWENS
ncbi:probable methyltransferase-like protein 24 [Branchiostoma lanceolatum]|uniref:probable methyltransferase-like protein 24 n=1 Tax=Branchiostoma lanceolatum TaxID=7740 RepID=UPI003456F3E3